MISKKMCSERGRVEQGVKTESVREQGCDTRPLSTDSPRPVALRRLSFETLPHEIPPYDAERVGVEVSVCGHTGDHHHRDQTEDHEDSGRERHRHRRLPPRRGTGLVLRRPGELYLKQTSNTNTAPS